MPPPPVILPATGATNGVNTIFYTQTGYVAGSLRVFLNGVLQRKDFTDGWVELGDGKFEMNIPPEVGDVVSAYYFPA